MEQSVLRPKPLPGQVRREGGAPGEVPRPHAAPRRGRLPWRLLPGLVTGAVLVLTGIGIGLGIVGTTPAGTGGPAGPPPPAQRPAPRAAGAAPAPPGATLGVETADAEKAGALVVGVHVPGPGYTAGLVRGDVLLRYGGTLVGDAADLARAVARTRPGGNVLLTVRHASGAYQELTVLPAVTT
ncbi:hypothetical protein GCM10010503_46920 [Streptomyces lucensis JCM 4490]|uniref:PDZ domain-containing protein n=1 Tax=Streptomyces lucensis JCM 4490 TaxID=1306176 RepID=A0A918JA61_9ACTN|nr:PDZ domain-containing protein [Streptomyces lucensis]GGW64348.1 hypothetical protein GCM10010503_46920 [Streptomyces lucensis JCM 4490]